MTSLSESHAGESGLPARVNNTVAWHIDKGALTLSERRRYRDRAHLRFVSAQDPWCASLAMGSSGRPGRSVGLALPALPKDSALAQWYRTRTEIDGRKRKTMIVALARKLLIARWRLATTGETPAGVVLRAS
jgi:hypothetical protein